MRRRVLLCVWIAAVSLAIPTFAGDETTGPALLGSDAEEFLRTAEVIARERIPIGVSRPYRVTLSDGQQTLNAIWKTIDEFRPKQVFANGGFELGFRDTWRHEVAAHRLDKLMGLGMVPPVVERTLNDGTGALQIWVDGSMTENERMKKGLRSPDPEAFNEQMFAVRLFHNLTYNTDFNNASNLLVDGSYKIWIIDHSRAFRTHKKLLAEGDLTRFSRRVLDGLRGLTKKNLNENLGEWLTKAQIKALLIRRDLILKRVESLVKESGEEAILFP